MQTVLQSATDTASPALALGNPRFTDPELAALAASEGALAAWRVAFERHGLQAPRGVTGDFAVGLRDGRGRTWLAVDRFAIRSMCHRTAGGGLAFAERADALGGGELDPQALFDYLYLHAIASPRTVFRDVHRLPAGHVACFEDGRLQVAAYWVPEFTESARSQSFASLRDEFRGLLREAVRDRLDGGKAGCFLSGGTDSSTVAGMIGEASGRPAATYSIGFEAEGYDEMEFARIAARRFGTEHHEYYVTPDDLVRTVPDVAAFYDQPFGNSSALPSYHCARMARADGVTRILAGDGGDELFGGNSRYAKQRVFNGYQVLPAALRRGLLEPFVGNASVGRTPLLKKGASYVEQARIPMPERQQMYNLLLRLGLEDVLTPGFLAVVDPAVPQRQQRRVWEAAIAEGDLNRTLAYDWRYTLAETDLPKVCGTTSFAGLQVAFPMLDQRLLDFSLRLPSAYKLKGLKLRWFFKEALRGFLPDEIIVKKKQGFGLPFGVWMTRHAGLHALAVDALGSFANRGIVRSDFIRTLIDRRLAEHPGYFGEMVWILMMQEHWMRRHAPDFRL